MTPEEQTNRFYQHIWPHRAIVLRTAQFLVRNGAEADDLAQETLMRAFRKIHQFDPASDPKAWLTAILRHARIDQSRLRGQSILAKAGPLADIAESDQQYEREVDPKQILDLLERLSDQHILNALQQIPEEIRWTLLLVDVEQMAYQDAADIMDIPPGTVKSRAHRGRQMLRELLIADKAITDHKLAPLERRIAP